jgi:hypothetical protein
MNTLTDRNIRFIAARSSEGFFYAISGTNKAARAALAQEMRAMDKTLSPGGYYLLTREELAALMWAIQEGIAA